MSELSHHGEWLSLIDVSGPFLAEPVLKDAFPQGLEGLDSNKKKIVRQAYDEWREALDLQDSDLDRIHRAWIDLILKRVLELDEHDDGDVLKPADKLPDTVRSELPEHGLTIRPDYAVVDDQPDSRPLILISVYGPSVSLGEALKGDGWPTSPAERMVELCRATDVRLGLVTNGEEWMFVDAPVGAVTSFASWYARLWSQEPVTLQAFANLLGIRRFFVDRSEQLPALLDKSLTHQDEVTDALGEQVRRAVEVLIQALDRADIDRNRELLDDVEPAELYEAGLTVMMRIVFLLSAEERGLLLLGDERYEANYAVSTLRMQLRTESEEILERRWDAWSRLLSIFRAVYGGINHEEMRLPALGGSLFDPDRFQFLEGRSKGSRWKADPATPLPIDNRTVLYLLDAVQLFEGRTLSYLALDVEQIGYVYEGLLERTVVRVEEVTLDLEATKNSKNPWVSLAELDDAAADGRAAAEGLLQNRTGSSASRVRNDLNRVVDDASADRLLTACHADQSLRDRVRPYFHFLRIDRWGYPLVYPKGAFMVMAGAARRETGTHYTPQSFTAAIVKETLEPLVYSGPPEGKPRNEWVLKSPAEILDLKICDPAMGSGAFLVQVCRWLAERLVESWVEAEKRAKVITAEGAVIDEIGSQEPLRSDANERLLTARRLIAERCLYGVDVNPLAVELAKLSIWLVTLAKGRPFGFLDHNLRCGDSLIGIHDLEQLYNLDINACESGSKKLFASRIDQAVEKAIAIRIDLRTRPIHDIRDVEVMANLDRNARQTLALPQLIADALVGETFAAKGRSQDTTALSIQADDAIEGSNEALKTLRRRALDGLNADLPTGKLKTKPFHWPLEFPEVFRSSNGGFDAIVGNPPFITGKRISTLLSDTYQKYLKSTVANSKGAADLCVFFIRRGFLLLKIDSFLGMIATKSIAEGDSRVVGIAWLLDQRGTIVWALHEVQWPGKASVTVSLLLLRKGRWAGRVLLNGTPVSSIGSKLREDFAEVSAGEPLSLLENKGLCSDGIKIQGEGFIISLGESEDLVRRDPSNRNVLKPYITGIDITQSVGGRPAASVISFGTLSYDRASAYELPFSMLVERVKPYRDRLTGQIHEKDFWKFWDKRENFFQRMLGSGRILACPSTSKYWVMTYIEEGWVPSHSVKLFAFRDARGFAVMQSTFHEAWAREQSGKLRAGWLAYNLTRAFSTFPWPSVLVDYSIGDRLYEVRNAVSMTKNICFTDLYNAFHDPSDTSSDIGEIRRLHKELDFVVATAYGWNDIELDREFREVPNLPENDRVRFAISESAEREILQRLTTLNRQRYEEQQSAVASRESRKPALSRSIPSTPHKQGSLFDDSGDKPLPRLGRSQWRG